ncbi:alkylphosphonate utilization protein [Phaeobacter sp. J2-8]|uniref:alkylphosphonate utilization protein n=1 Tax=Phaeobacter sp. J2-8 TaxID=2931394 RepID=UPI001FCFCD75|nr:alkylphosphonate utilization protein [Phaeobacter sp. J2-8]MCJ7872350.1 alkylphosphonate utilization protein [Phaeobacter sp. J2-8]
MSVLSFPVRLTGARILHNSGLEDHALTIADGHISNGPAREIDMTGYDILPGIVDLHARAPVSNSLPNLPEVEHDLLSRGVTTGWLAQDWGWQGGAKSPDFAEALLLGMASYQARMTSDLRIMLRSDIHMMDSEHRFLTLLRQYDIDAVLFVDHVNTPALPSDDELRRIAEGLRARGDEVHRHLCNLAHAFDVLNVRSGSYGDRDGQSRERLAMMGAKICAAPEAVGAAAVARAWGDPVLMPARGVMNGPDQPGAPVARDMITGGMCDALISDGAPETMHRAALHLWDTGTLPLAGAWSLISARPAQTMGLLDRGVLVPGARADLVVLHRASRRIAATMAQGRWVWRAPDIAPSCIAPSCIASANIAPTNIAPPNRDVWFGAVPNLRRAVDPIGPVAVTPAPDDTTAPGETQPITE